MKKKTILIVAVLIGILLSAGIYKFYFADNDSNEKNKKGKTAVIDETKSANENAGSKELRTKTGKTIMVTETHPMGVMISTITITTKGFKENKSIELEDIDPIEKIQLKDLDNNGFEEIYFFTRSGGSGAGGDLYVYASDKDERLVKCEKEELDKDQYCKGGFLEGFIGNNTYSFDENMVVMEFPLFEDNDLKSSTTGVIKKIYYTLNQPKLEIIKINANGAVYIKDERGNFALEEEKKADENDNTKEFKTKTRRTIVVTESHPFGPMVSNINITTKGFKENKLITLEDIDPIEKIQLKDLDNNGFDEMYLFTRSVGSEGGSDLYVYASDKDDKLVKCEKEKLDEME
ncbi:MAG: hypothetical protein ABI850_16630, partial [Flavobacterium sp.]